MLLLITIVWEGQKPNVSRRKSSCSSVLVRFHMKWILTAHFGNSDHSATSPISGNTILRQFPCDWHIMHVHFKSVVHLCVIVSICRRNLAKYIDPERIVTLQIGIGYGNHSYDFNSHNRYQQDFVWCTNSHCCSCRLHSANSETKKITLIVVQFLFHDVFAPLSRRHAAIPQSEENTVATPRVIPQYSSHGHISYPTLLREGA